MFVCACLCLGSGSESEGEEEPKSLYDTYDADATEPVEVSLGYRFDHFLNILVSLFIVLKETRIIGSRLESR